VTAGLKKTTDSVSLPIQTPTLPTPAAPVVDDADDEYPVWPLPPKPQSTPPPVAVKPQPSPTPSRTPSPVGDNAQNPISASSSSSESDSSDSGSSPDVPPVPLPSGSGPRRNPERVRRPPGEFWILPYPKSPAEAAEYVEGTILTHTHLSLTSVRFSDSVIPFHLSILSCLHLFIWLLLHTNISPCTHSGPLSFSFPVC